MQDEAGSVNDFLSQSPLLAKLKDATGGHLWNPAMEKGTDYGRNENCVSIHYLTHEQAEELLDALVTTGLKENAQFRALDVKPQSGMQMFSVYVTPQITDEQITRLENALEGSMLIGQFHSRTHVLTPASEEAGEAAPITPQGHFSQRQPPLPVSFSGRQQAAAKRESSGQQK